MKGKRFTEEQIIRILKEHEAGAKVQDLVRKHNVSEQSIYRWKAKYGGMEVSEAKRLRELENENSKLKRLLADAMLDNAALKELVSKMYGPPRFCKINNWRGKSGLLKCIRPVYGIQRSLAMMEIRT